MNRSKASAAGLIRLCGIWLSGKGCPVCGSMIGTGLAEKSPDRNASPGTVAYWSNRLRLRPAV